MFHLTWGSSSSAARKSQSWCHLNWYVNQITEGCTKKKREKDRFVHTSIKYSLLIFQIGKKVRMLPQFCPSLQSWHNVLKAGQEFTKRHFVAVIICANFPKTPKIIQNCQLMLQIGSYHYQHLHLCKSFYFSHRPCLHWSIHPLPKKSPDVDKIFCPGDISPCSFIEVTVNAYVLSSYLSNCTLEVSILSCQLQWKS